MFSLLAGANVPTPLYDVYRREWNLSPFELAAVFATYPLTLVGALWGFARISDRFGRRPVIAASLAAAALGAVLFALAHGPGELFAARFIQAVGVGLLSGSGSAALVELEPHGDRHRAALISTSMLAAGSAAGPLVSGILAQYAPFPEVLSYAVYLACVLPLAILALLLPETAPAAGNRRAHWLPHLPVLDAAVRRPFAVASASGGLAWLTASILFSLVPSYLSVTLGVRNLAFAGFVPFAMLATSAVIQFALRPAAERLLMGCGLLLAALGTACLVLAVPLHVVALVAVAALVCGVGHACGVKGSLATIARIAPEQIRGEMFSLHYAIVYLIIGVPMLAVGALATAFGFFLGFAIFAAIVTTLALCIGIALWSEP